MAAGKLEISVVARLEQLDKDLARVEQKVHKTAGKIEGSLSKGMSKVAGLASKLAIAFAAIEVALLSVENSVHVMHGGLAILRGDAEGLQEAFEGWRDSFLKLPIVGPMLESWRNSLVGIADLALGISKEMEKQDKILEKLARTHKANSQSIAILQATEALKAQREILLSTSATQRDQLDFALKIVALEEQRTEKTRVLLQLTERYSRDRAAGLKVIEREFEVLKDILYIQKEMKEQDRWDQYFKAVGAAGNTLDILRAQTRVLNEQTNTGKATAQLELERIALHEEIHNRTVAITENENLSERQKKSFIQMLKTEKELRANIQNINHQITLDAIADAEAAEKKAAAIEKQSKLTNDLLDKNKEALRIEEKQLQKVQQRLGSMSSTAQGKSGFTVTAQTAMGSYTFGEQNYKQKIQSMMREQQRIQNTIATTTGVIAQLLASIANNFGFK